MFPGIALIARPSVATCTRPASLPVLGSPSAAYRAHYDFPAPDAVTRGATGNLVIAVANSLTGGAALGPLAVVDQLQAALRARHREHPAFAGLTTTATPRTPAPRGAGSTAS